MHFLGNQSLDAFNIQKTIAFMHNRFLLNQTGFLVFNCFQSFCLPATISSFYFNIILSCVLISFFLFLPPLFLNQLCTISLPSHHYTFLLFFLFFLQPISLSLPMMFPPCSYISLLTVSGFLQIPHLMFMNCGNT